MENSKLELIQKKFKEKIKEAISEFESESELYFELDKIEISMNREYFAGVLTSKDYKIQMTINLKQ
jgi:hypothetical protein